MTLVVVLIQMKLVSVAIVESKAMIYVYAGNSMAIVLDARSLVTWCITMMLPWTSTKASKASRCSRSLDYIPVESKVLYVCSVKIPPSKWFEMWPMVLGRWSGPVEEKLLRPWDMLQVSLPEDHNDKKKRWNCHCFEMKLKRLSVGTQTGGMFGQLSLTRSDLVLICKLSTDRKGCVIYILYIVMFRLNRKHRH
jgi:hypothetical protein